MSDNQTLAIDRWSALALSRFWLSFVVAVNHLKDFTDLAFLSIIPKFGAFQSIIGFLLISGYSIGESHQSNPKNFYLRRFKRIYPIYLAATVLTIFVTNPSWNSDFVLTVLINLAFLNQLLTSGSLIGPAWSLSLEVWLYALTPFLSNLKYKTLEVLCWASLTAFTVYTFGRSLFGWNYYSGVGYGLNLPLLGSFWIFGYYLSRSLNKDRVLKLTGLALIGVQVVFFGIQVIYRIKNQAFSFLMDDFLNFALQSFNLAIIWLILRRYTTASPQYGKRIFWMSFLGDVSYPLYLLHIAVFQLLTTQGIVNPFIMILTSVAVSILVFIMVDFYSIRRHYMKQTRSIA